MREGNNYGLLAHVEILSIKIRGKAKYCISYIYATERTHICPAFALLYSFQEISSLLLEQLRDAIT